LRHLTRVAPPSCRGPLEFTRRLFPEDPIAMHALARTLFFGTLTGLAFGLLGALEAARAAGNPPPGRVVYVARGLPDEALITLGAAVAAKGDGLLLLDSGRSSPY